MLSPAEKAYCLALKALKDKEYRRAADFFDRASGQFRENPDFVLLWETTRLLLAVKEELKANEHSDGIEIEEVYYGQEDELR